MSTGYACLNIGTPEANIRSVMQRNDSRLQSFIIANGAVAYSMSNDIMDIEEEKIIDDFDFVDVAVSGFGTSKKLKPIHLQNKRNR